MDKRVVFLHPDGIYEICGVEQEPRIITAENFTLRGRFIEFASLFKVTTRAAYYREPIVPASNGFHEAQR